MLLTFYHRSQTLCLQPVQLYYDNLWAVVDTNRDDTVSKASTDNHGGILFSVSLGIILRKKSLIRSNDPTDEWQAELSAMGMTAQYQVNVFIAVHTKVLGPMRQKNCIALMVAVLGRKENALEMGKLYTKLMAACYRQKYASGIYTSGVVFEPQFYEDFADMMKEDKLPIFNWIWFGMYRSEKGMNAYTYGLDLFDKEEMEVLDVDATPQDLRDFLASLSNYVLENDVKLRDGETIAFSATGKHTIIRSPSVSLPKDQMTLKISWGSFGGAPDRTSENDHNSE